MANEIITPEAAKEKNENSKEVPTSIFEFSDNSQELIDQGITWDDPRFRDLYKISLSLSQSLELPPQELYRS